MNENEDDDLLRKLGEMARDEAESERARWDERWDRLAAGMLGAEEEAELRRLATASPEAGEAYEAFRPLGAEFHAAVAAAIAAQGAGAAEPPVAGEPAALTGQPGGRLLPYRRTARRLAAWGAAVGAAAAALVTVVLRAPPLPAYAIAELSGGASATRSERGEAPQLSPGDRFQAILRPETTVSRGASLRTEACLLREGELRRLEVESEPAPGGSVRVTGTLDRELPAGTWTLWLIVGRKGALPDPADLRTLPTAVPVRERNWVALPKTLRIEPRAPE